MTAITGKALDVTGAGVSGLVVRATLVAASNATATGEIVNPAATVTAGDGSWSLNLVPVSQLVQPTGAYYTLTVGGASYSVTAPDNGPVTLASALVVPGPLPAAGATVAALAGLAATYLGQILTPDPGQHWYMGSNPFDAGITPVTGDRFTYQPGHAQAGQTYRYNGTAWVLERVLTALPASVMTAAFGTGDALVDLVNAQTVAGVKTFTDKPTVHDITVVPNAGISTSASMFLDNTTGQVWEFFCDSGAQFGVYDHVTNRQVMRIAPGAPQDSIHVDALGGVNVAAKNGLAALQVAGYKNTAGKPTTGTWGTGDLVVDSAG
ncbi:MAG TPA: hypothetical protein VF482_17520, partial [Trebonia sp.]